MRKITPLCSVAVPCVATSHPTVSSTCAGLSSSLSVSFAVKSVRTTIESFLINVVIDLLQQLLVPSSLLFIVRVFSIRRRMDVSHGRICSWRCRKLVLSQDVPYFTVLASLHLKMVTFIKLCEVVVERNVSSTSLR